jgi:acyl transferase
MRTARLNATSATGRRVAVWRSVPDGPAERIVVIAPGFGQRMRSGGMLTQFLTRNATTVYRFDALDHVGLSDGTIENYHLAPQAESLATVCELVEEIDGVDAVTVVATSLAAPSTFHHVATHPAVERLVCLVGAVDVAHTVASACGTDYYGLDLADLPHRVTISNHQVDPRLMWHEGRERGWHTASSTVEALAGIQVPVTNFVAKEDDWVDTADVHEVFGAAGRAGDVVELPMSGHTLLRNPVALSGLFTEVTRLVTGAADDAVVPAPTFEETVALRAAERELERDQQISDHSDRTTEHA